MTPEIALLVGIILVGLVLFSIERFPADVVALGILVVLVLTGLLPADQAFAGFGSDAVMLILGLLILTAALVRTGVVDLAGRYMTRFTGSHPNRMLIAVMGASSLLSTVMSNTASTAFFLPIVIGMARKARISSSRLLMPLAFSTILASSVTLVATSTNIIVSGLMVTYNLPPLGLFELTPVGLPILLVGIAYMYFIGKRMIPERESVSDTESSKGYEQYLTETVILPESPLAGKTLSQAGLGRDLDLTVLRVVRDHNRYLAPRADLTLQENDVLLLEGHRDEILKIKNTAGIDIKAEVDMADPSLESDEVRLVDVILLPRSPLLRRTLRGLNFRERYQVQVLAVSRQGETIRSKLADVRLRLGDVLLLQGSRAAIRSLEEDNSIRVLEEHAEKLPHLQRAPIALISFLGALLLGALNILSLPVALFIGVLAVFVTRCITPEEAYREVEWRVLILIGSMLALGVALEHTGAARYFAMQIVEMVGSSSPYWLLAGFFILTMLLTQPMSNQAAAVVVVPIAIQTALQLGLNPRTFAVMIALGASASFLTPLEPACVMVYGAGNYRFLDFIKVGSLLTLAIFMLAIVLVPIIWPL
jgi:di/tricarboxylate transporter